MPSVVNRETASPYAMPPPVPPLTSAVPSSDPYLPPVNPIRPRGAPPPASPCPVRVKTWITPVTASEPYSTLTGPRTISTRSTASVVRFAKSNEPPGWFWGTPSTSTFT